MEGREGEARTDVAVAAGDLAQDRHELATRDALQDVAGGAGLDRGDEVVLVLGHGEHDDPRLGAGVVGVGRRGDPAARHVDVEQGEVGLELDDEPDRVSRDRRLADDVEPGDRSVPTTPSR